MDFIVICNNINANSAVFASFSCRSPSLQLAVTTLNSTAAGILRSPLMLDA